MKKEFQNEYENYMKGIVNKFSDLCSVKMDYQDYCIISQNKIEIQDIVSGIHMKECLQI